MKIIMLNGPKGAGKDEAAKAFVSHRMNVEFRPLGYARSWPYSEIVSLFNNRDQDNVVRLPDLCEYIIVVDCYSPDCGVEEAIALVGPNNVCVVNVYRDGYGWNETEGTYFAAANGNKEQEFELYNNGSLEELGAALARIVEAWELGETHVQVYTGRPN